MIQITIFNRLGNHAFNNIYIHKTNVKTTNTIDAGVNDTAFVNINHIIANTEYIMKKTPTIFLNHFGKLTQKEYNATAKEKSATKTKIAKTIIANVVI
jgi:hypothetical protein